MNAIHPPGGTCQVTPPADYGAGILLHIVIEDPSTVQDELTAAVQTIQETTPNEGCQGILITRHSRALYTVTLSTEVPYGITYERDRWDRQF